MFIMTVALELKFLSEKISSFSSRLSSFSHSRFYTFLSISPLHFFEGAFHSTQCSSFLLEVAE